MLAVARTAAAYGARILTYVAAERLRADGATVRDSCDGDGGGASTSARATSINATGVWAGELSGGAVRLQPSKGSHLLVPAAAVGEPRAAVNAPLPGDGTRFVFAVPRPDGLVMIGITDAPFDGPIPDVPAVDADEEAFLLTSIGRVLERTPTRGGRRRPLRRPAAAAGGDDGRDAATADLSRRHAVVEHDGVVTVVGGKLTTARRMAQDALDRDRDAPGAERAARASRTASASPAPTARPATSPRSCASRVTHELALTVDDLLDRRTRLGLVPARARRGARAPRTQALAARGRLRLRPGRRAAAPGRPACRGS